MPERQKMNSERLKSSFPEVYRELFSKCAIVTSAPAVFHWAGEYAMNFGGPAISQKILLRTYVGLELIGGTGSVEVGEQLCYNPARDRFREVKKNATSILGEIKKTAIRLHGNEDFPGFKIHVLSEVPDVSGLNSGATLLASLTSAMAILLGAVSVDDYGEMIQLPVREVSKHKSFNLIFREAWKLNTSLHNGISSGASIFSSMAYAKYPIVYFTEKRDGSSSRFSFNMIENLSGIDKLKYTAIDIGDYFGIQGPPIWNIVFALVYSGNTKRPFRVSRSILNINESLRQTTEAVKKAFDGGELNTLSPLFSQMVKKDDPNGARDVYISMLSFLSLDIMRSLRDTFSHGLDSSLSNLVNLINLYNDILRFLERNYSSADRICSILKDDRNEVTEGLGIAVKVCGVGKGGDILLVVPSSSVENAENHIKSATDRIAHSTQKEIFVDYLSLWDGDEFNGLLLEQFIDKGIYSDMISRDTVRLTTFKEKGEPQSTVVSREKLEDSLKKIDLLIDTTKGDIFIRGKLLSSKEIFSSKYTAEFLEILLKSPNKEITNRVLPRSSYSTNRNEFQGKILVPLKKELTKIAKRDLDISITGTADNFNLKLKPSNCEVSFLEKVF